MSELETAMLGALVKVEAALRCDSRQQTISGDTTEYHLRGEEMWRAINAARDAIALASQQDNSPKDQ